jgi:hypothetical protein
MKFADGDIYEGGSKDGKAHGKGKYTSAYMDMFMTETGWMASSMEMER